jgi:hypothetical protein
MNLLCERKQSQATFNLVPLRVAGGVMCKRRRQNPSVKRPDWPVAPEQ